MSPVIEKSIMTALATYRRSAAGRSWSRCAASACRACVFEALPGGERAQQSIVAGAQGFDDDLQFSARDQQAHAAVSEIHRDIARVFRLVGLPDAQQRIVRCDQLH